MANGCSFFESFLSNQIVGQFYDFRTDSELKNDIQSSMLKVANLRRQNKIDNTSLSVLMYMLASQYIDIQLNSMFPSTPYKTTWLVPKRF
jgi:hypothetical protein